MKRTTHAIFSADHPTINVKLPTAWQQLTQQELHDVYSIICTCTANGIEGLSFRLFRYFGKVKVLRRENDGFVCSLACKDGKNVRRIVCRIIPELLAELLEPLSFIHDPGFVPVRLDKWHGAVAVNAQLHGLTFGEYLQVENLYQGFITSNNMEAVKKLAAILYPGLKHKYVDNVFVYNLLQWMVQVKQSFARMWPNFFRPVTEHAESPSMLEVMNNEIRVLTGGDVTKEEVILGTECWRALTELDFKAKEAEEFKRQMAKSN